jgi:plasmid stabilization system protein ParE
MPAVMLSPQAELDLAGRIAYLRSFSAQAAQSFESEVRLSFKRLATFPGMGAVWPTKRKRLQGIRVITVPKYRNYLVFYRPAAEQVLIIRVLHGAQNLRDLLDDTP